MELRFEVSGEQQITRAFFRFAEGINDITPALEQIADDFKEVEADQFDSEGSFGLAGRWAGLSPTYASWKAKHFPGAKILERTGTLRESLAAVNQHTVRDVQPLSVTLGTTLDYGRYHQQGRGLPQRKVIDLNEDTKRRWVGFIQQFLVEKKREAWQ